MLQTTNSTYCINTLCTIRTKRRAHTLWWNNKHIIFNTFIYNSLFLPHCLRVESRRCILNCINNSINLVHTSILNVFIILAYCLVFIFSNPSYNICVHDLTVITYKSDRVDFFNYIITNWLLKLIFKSNNIYLQNLSKSNDIISRRNTFYVILI